MKQDKKLIECEEKNKELNEKYLRALADYQNLEKREAVNKEEYSQRIQKTLLEKFLPVWDTLKQLKDQEQYKNDEGINLVWKQFNAVLEGYGLRGIIALGSDFNPYKMECVEVIPGEDNKVMEELQKGFTFHDKALIRPAKVKVGKSVIDKKEEELAKDQLQKGDYM